METFVNNTPWCAPVHFFVVEDEGVNLHQPTFSQTRLFASPMQNVTKTQLLWLSGMLDSNDAVKVDKYDVRYLFLYQALSLLAHPYGLGKSNSVPFSVVLHFGDVFCWTPMREQRRGGIMCSCWRDLESLSTNSSFDEGVPGALVVISQLSTELQRKIADELDRTPSEILKKLEDIRQKIC